MSDVSPIILSIDTANSVCGCGVWNSAMGEVHQKIDVRDRGHAEILMPMIQDVLKDAGKEFSDLSGIVVTTGPGGFTGVRVGMSAAKSLALALTIPVYGVSSFEAITHSFISAQPDLSCDRILCVLDSKRDQLFVQEFQANGEVLNPPLLMSLEEIESYYNALPDGFSLDIIGNAPYILKESLCFKTKGGTRVLCDYDKALPECLCDYGYNQSNVSQRGVSPLYLRDADTSVSKKKIRMLEKA